MVYNQTSSCWIILNPYKRRKPDVSLSLIIFLFLAQNYLMDCQLYEFHYIKEEKNWTEAQQYCRENHTDLATATNMKDMKRLISISLRDINEAWIGLYDQTNAERAWHWSLPGVEFNKSETNWEKDEPNNKGTGGQNCVIIWRDASDVFISQKMIHHRNTT
uniref:C-type lectin domain-containing protein n=1 Tax=Poecilia reticulata TaxID=8081 RepID=A0A3P9NMC1_POERE